MEKAFFTLLMCFVVLFVFIGVSLIESHPVNSAYCVIIAAVCFFSANLLLMDSKAKN